MKKTAKQTPAALKKRIRQLEKCLHDVQAIASRRWEDLVRMGPEVHSLNAMEFSAICARINRTL